MGKLEFNNIKHPCINSEEVYNYLFKKFPENTIIHYSPIYKNINDKDYLGLKVKGMTLFPDYRCFLKLTFLDIPFDYYYEPIKSFTYLENNKYQVELYNFN